EIVRFNSALKRRVKDRTSSGMSSRRSRNGGGGSVMTLSTSNNARRKFPVATCSLNSHSDAARTRAPLVSGVPGRGSDSARAIGRHDDNGQSRVQGVDLLEAVETVDAGHPHVHHDELRRLLRNRAECVVDSARNPAFMALVAEEVLERLRDREIVIDDQNV